MEVNEQLQLYIICDVVQWTIRHLLLKIIMWYAKYVNTAAMSVNIEAFLFVYLSCLYICHYIHDTVPD